MNMLNEKINDFLKESGPIFFVTPSIGRAIGLEKELLDFHIVCAQKSDSVELLRKAGVKVFCLEKDIKNSGKVLADAQTIDYIKNNSAGKKANIITFKPSPMIEKICEKNDFRYLGNNSVINRGWEDKVRFAEITAELGVPNANSKVLKIGEENLQILKDLPDFSTGKKYVIQFSRGYSGNSTFLVKNFGEFEEILKNNIGRKIKIADFKEGDTYTFDVCVGEFGTLISQPILQLTGFSEFNKNTLGTCGNDFAYGKNLSIETKNNLSLNIKKVTTRLLEIGYRGILGFDFVVKENEVNLIEVNPRLVGSIPVFTKLQLIADEMPFLLLHILSFLDFDFKEIEIKEPKQNFEFSQVILRNTGNEPVKIAKSIPSGIYKLNDGKIIFQREAYFAENGMAQDEFFIDCASEGELIDPDMEYANIQVFCGIMKASGIFKEDFVRIKEEILKKMVLV
jgi:predicted ATP-grasp superfamily ATP-dependent carboligase